MPAPPAGVPGAISQRPSERNASVLPDGSGAGALWIEKRSRMSRALRRAHQSEVVSRERQLAPRHSRNPMLMAALPRAMPRRSLLLLRVPPGVVSAPSYPALARRDCCDGSGTTASAWLLRRVVHSKPDRSWWLFINSMTQLAPSRPVRHWDPVD